ncbi:MAG: SGNH/GDSL hydrolase family protein [Alphaproteobacteria bacterium]|nr:SGNH/GDSL hydrolase family protein [Alphaproteobacteria bacterium]
MGIDRRKLVCGVAASVGAASAARGQQPTHRVIPPWEVQAAPIGSSEDELRIHTDWAQLGQYREDNLQVRALPAAERRVSFMGDSITRAWRVFRPEFFTSSGFIDRGISGQTTPQMLVRFRQDVISLEPEAVHIMAGTNDVAENTGPYDPPSTKNNLMSMVELARIHRLRIVLATIPPAAAFPWRTVAEPVAKLRALNEWIREYARINRFVLADYAPLLDDGAGGMKAGLAYDGVHPTSAGYLVMEQVTARAIAEALA